MQQQKINELKNAMLKVANDFNLPNLNSIKIHSPVWGYSKRGGTCKKATHRKTGVIKYNILVYITQPKYIPSPHGTYIHKITKERLKKVAGEDYPIKEIINSCAHELAHIKFWSHNKDHTNFTTILEQKIMEELKNMGWNFEV